MKWSAVWTWALAGFTLLAFMIGAMAANASILWLRMRDKVCVGTNEAVIDRFLKGSNFFSLSLNILGILIAIAGMIWRNWQVIKSLKNLMWLLKDFVFGLSMYAAVVTLLSVWDIKHVGSGCAMESATWVIVLSILSLIFSGFYVLLRMIMVFTAKNL